MKFLNRCFTALIGSVVLTLAACGGGGSSSVLVASAPGAPTGLVATAGNALATVTFTAPTNNGGSAISAYTVSSSPAGGVDREAGTSAVNHLVTGLTNGVRYTFTVTASNATGVSGASNASNEVTPHPPTPAAWSVTGSLQKGRYGHTSTLLANGKVLVAGGIFMPGDNFNASPPVYLSSTEQYDPATKAWTTAAPLATARYGHTATVLPNGKVMIVGGVGSVSAGPTTSVELYDPASNAWTVGAPLATSRLNHTATLLTNGKVLVVGGFDNFGNMRATVELYDPASNVWTNVSPLATARYNHTAVLLTNGKVLVIGGWGDAGVLPGVGLYDPATNAWTATAQPRAAFGAGTSTLLPSGKVLFVSGYKPNGSTRPDAEVYDPVTNIWTVAGTLTTAHELHTATVLSNGTVLVVGGGGTSAHSATNYATDVAELYDPSTNTWSLTNPLVVGPRLGHTATLLPNGEVLVGGGTKASGWLYQTPSTDAALYKFL